MGRSSANIDHHCWWMSKIIRDHQDPLHAGGESQQWPTYLLAQFFLRLRCTTQLVKIKSLHYNWYEGISSLSQCQLEPLGTSIATFFEQTRVAMVDKVRREGQQMTACLKSSLEGRADLISLWTSPNPWQARLINVLQHTRPHFLIIIEDLGCLPS